MPARADENAYARSMMQWQASIDGQDVPIKAIVREPFEAADDDWICATTISGLFHRKADLRGTTPDEAVAAARRFLKTELNAFHVPGTGAKDTDNEARQRLWRMIDSV